MYVVWLAFCIWEIIVDSWLRAILQQKWRISLFTHCLESAKLNLQAVANKQENEYLNCAQDRFKRYFGQLNLEN